MILNFRFSGDADCLVEIFSWCLVEILKMRCDQDLCLNLWYDFKKLVWQDELNPRVRCAFGNVYNTPSLSPNQVQKRCATISFLAMKVETQKLSLPRKGMLKVFNSQLFRSKKKWSSERSEHFEQQYPIRAERWRNAARRWEHPKMYPLELYPIHIMMMMKKVPTPGSGIRLLIYVRPRSTPPHSLTPTSVKAGWWGWGWWRSWRW